MAIPPIKRKESAVYSVEIGGSFLSEMTRSSLFSRLSWLCVLTAAPFAGVVAADLSEDVKRLAAPTFHERETAEETIWEKGEAAREVLEAAARSDDPEIAFRAQRLLEYIALDLVPGNSEDVIEVVREFERASEARREQMIEELLQNRSERMALMLSNKGHPSPYLGADRSLEIVRSAVRQDPKDDEAAIAMLELLPRFPEAGHALAGYLAASGKIDAWRANRPADMRPVFEQRAEVMALVFAERIAEGMEKAQEYELADLERRIHMLQGDPTPLAGEFLRINGMFGNGGASMKQWFAGGLHYESEVAKIEAALAGAGSGEAGQRMDFGSAVTLGHYAAVLEAFGSKAWADYAASTEDYELFLKVVSPDGTEEGLIEKTRQSFANRSVEGGRAELLERTTEFFEFDVVAFYAERERYEVLDAILGPAKEQLSTEPIDARLTLLAQLMVASPDYALKIIEENPHVTSEHLSQLMELYFPDNFSRIESWIKDLINSGVLDRMAAAGDRHPLRTIFELIGRCPVDDEEFTPTLGTVDAVLNGRLERATMQRLLVFGLRQNLLAAMSLQQPGDDDSLFSERLIIFGLVSRQPEIFQPVFAQFEQMLLRQNGIRELPSELLFHRAFGEEIAEEEKRGVRSEQPDDGEFMRMVLADPDILAAVPDEIATLGQTNTAYKLSVMAFFAAEQEEEMFKALESLAEFAFRTQQWSVAAAAYQVLTLNGGAEFRELNSSAHLTREFQPAARLAMCRGVLWAREGDAEAAKSALTYAAYLYKGSGLGADEFYPVLRTVVDAATARELYELTAAPMKKSIESFPSAANLHNSLAWVASRAVQDLDNAARWSDLAVNLDPWNPAYIDTRAEVWFAKGNREKALELSQDALQYCAGDLQIWGQYRHFRYDPLP